MMRYLKNEDIKKADAITGLKIVKNALHAIGNELYERLLPGPASTSPSSPSPPPPVDEAEKPDTLYEKLKKVVKESTEEQHQTHVSSSLVPDFKMFEATRKRTEKLDALFQALMTVKPTSVESERAFSLGGSFCTKVRSRMSSGTLSALVSLKMYFKRQTVSASMWN